MAKLHYSVRRSVQWHSKFKIVIVGGFWGEDDTGLPLFDSFNEALSACERLNNFKGS